MTGSQIGGGLGFILSGGNPLGTIIGSIIGGIISPQKIKGPKLSDAQIQTVQEGAFIPFGYGSFPARGHLIACTTATEHKREEGGKGGPVTVTYYYTRTYAIGVCLGGRIVRVKRNGKLVYDITPGSTILGKNAKFLRDHTLYDGTQTTNDPDLEAAFGEEKVHPYKGLTFLVAKNAECPNAAAVDNYEFVVQNCGTVTNAADTRAAFVASLDFSGSIATTTRTGNWTHYAGATPGDKMSRIAAQRGSACAFGITNPQEFWFTTDRGETWAPSTPASHANRLWYDIFAGPNNFVAVGIGTGPDAGNSYALVSTDSGANFTEINLGFAGAMGGGYGAGVYVIVTESGGDGIFRGAALNNLDNVSAVTNLNDVFYNGESWLAVGGDAKTYSAPATADDWTFESQIGTGSFSFEALTGGPGYFVAGATMAQGIFRTTDNGANWTDVSAVTGTAEGAAAGLGVLVVGFNSSCQFSEDEGLTWTSHPPPHNVSDVAFFGPSPRWFRVPDVEDLWADEEGTLIADYVENQFEASGCGITVGEIVEDLCLRAGIEIDEIDVSELTDEIDGYSCATESDALGFIEPLQQSHFFDIGEWDKKIRFPKRGGAAVAALTVEDLLARGDGTAPPIEKDQVQEVELLRKVNILTCNPEAEYATTKQTWQRRSSLVVALGERTSELPIVIGADETAQIAEKTGKVAWSETEKSAFGLTLKHAALTPTDVVTLTDRAGVVHRIRLGEKQEEENRIEHKDAWRDRASCYVSTATGVTNPNIPPPVDTVAGPTLLAVMQLPQPLRLQDNTAGVYAGVAGVLVGWPGAQVLLSVDGGLSYSVVLSVTEPTKMGYLETDFATAGVTVRVYGGDLESKTTAQVATGANYSGLITDGVTEVISYEDAVEQTSPGLWDLDVIDQALIGTAAADHSEGDQFVDLNTSYFIPIDQAHAGQTLYMKAVAYGVSADAVDPVSFVFAGAEFVLDGNDAP